MCIRDRHNPDLAIQSKAFLDGSLLPKLIDSEYFFLRITKRKGRERGVA